MKTSKRYLVLALSLLVLLVLFSQSSYSQYSYLPTGDITDGRFLQTRPGPGISGYIINEAYEIMISTPSSSAQLEIGLFDGDFNDVDPVNSNWDDAGPNPTDFSLYADPLANGTGTFLVGRWRSNGTAFDNIGNPMPNNGWLNIILPNVPEALSPAGNYHYRFLYEVTNPTSTGCNAFKIRSNGPLAMMSRGFGFVAALSGWSDMYILFPTAYDLGLGPGNTGGNIWETLPTTYDATWDFYVDVPVSVSFLMMMDGDLDCGSTFSGTTDTDDTDTPAVIPPFATATEATSEGAKGIGNPADDFGNVAYRRSPAVYYTLTTPDGAVFPNNNPSGNLEWEQFLIETDSSKPADYQISQNLPPGLYHV
ncbi:hypothetical protein JW935_11795 [candidate division KSB1 bacterium]|nr:hypothetical protein [candidate division KSB1 bacterium]